MISVKKDLIDLDLTIKFKASTDKKKTVNQRVNLTQWSNYLPQRADICIIQRSHLAPQRAKNTPRGIL